MAEETKSTNEQNTDTGAEQKDFNSLSLDEMEKELSKVPENVKSVTDATDDSVDSEEESDESESTDEKSEDGDDTDETSEDTSEDVDDKSTSKEQVKSEKSDKSLDVNKAYKELQAEFTRRNQERKKVDEQLAQLQAQVESLKKPAQSDAEKVVEDKFAQLKKNNPNATKFLDDLQNAVNEVVQQQLKEKVAPIEERVTFRTRQENIEKFDRDIEAFKTSELKELEPEVLSAYNADPNFWQRLILDNDDAFQQLVNKVVLANLDKVVELKARKKQADPIGNKKKIIAKAQIGKPSGSTKEIPTPEFKKLSLKQMEDALPKAD